MSSLDRIRVKGFTSIRELDLNLRPLNVLIGANGAGKTNFIMLFRLLNEIVSERMRNYVTRMGGAERFLHQGSQNTEEIEIRLTFNNEQNGYDLRLLSTFDNDLYFGNEQIWYLGHGHTTPYIAPIGQGHYETNLFDEASRRGASIAHHVIDNLKSWRVYHFHDTSDTAKVKKPHYIGDNLALAPDASNLAAFLYLLRETEAQNYRLIVKTIRQIAPFFKDFVLRPIPQSPDQIRLEWQENNSDTIFTANHLSDGTLRFISLTTLLLQPILPSTILIDEPELGLHPQAIFTLASLLRSASQKTQVIVSTQSVPLINHIPVEDILVVDRVEGQSTFNHLVESDYADWLEDFEYSLGDLWEKNIIGGTPQPE